MIRNCKCQCSSPQQKCIACICVRDNVRCRGCRKGDRCQNPLGRDPPQGGEETGAQAALNPDNSDSDDSEDEPEQPDLEVSGPVAPSQGAPDVDNGPPGSWKGLPRDGALSWVRETYSEIVKWSPLNLFEPPPGGATKEMIREMTSLISDYTNDSPLAPIALHAVAIIPQLFCQRTHSKSKQKEDAAALRRRVSMWQKGELEDLLSEARTLHERRHDRTDMPEQNDDIARRFGNKMRAGKVSAATRSITKEALGVLPLTRETVDLLKEKHPPASEEDGLLLEGIYNPPNPIMFEKITGDMVWKKAVRTQGGAGPSGLNANSWRVILSTNKFGATSTQLCNAIAALARKLASSPCQHLHALTASRLIPLNKNPGCRPIGIGEVLRRIIGKCIMEVTKDDVRAAAGNLQVCAGQQAGGEAAIHAMRKIYERDDCEAVLLVDASNAFNSINRKATLHNIKIKCPSLAQFVENTYKEPVDLYISTNRAHVRDNVIQSTEGTTQGDPVAMAMYALGLSALQYKINHESTRVKHVAYADDLTGAGKIDDIKHWWELVTTYGPKVGYHPNASKSFLIVKPQHYNRAVDAFRGSDVKVTAEGQRHLGAVIGTSEFKIGFIRQKVCEWVKEINTLSDIAKTEPQAAYTAFTHGVKHRWTYLMRTIPDVSPHLQPLEDAIRNTFIPAVTKIHDTTVAERALLALPPRLGGLGITNPVLVANKEFENSSRLTAALTNHIIEQDISAEADIRAQHMINMAISNDRQTEQHATLRRSMQELSMSLRRKVEAAQELGASNWLTTLPIRAKGFNLNKQEFTDAIALRYGKPVDGLPSICVCGSSYTIDHAMLCKKGGFICIRHDEIRDLTAKMLKEVCHEVTVEPSLLPVTDERFRHRTANTSNGARVDISARGFWTRGQRAFLDIRIFDPMAACYRPLSLDAAHKKNETEKTRKYAERILNVDHGSFTPLIFTTSGGMSPRTQCFYARLAELLAEKKHQPRSYVVAWMRCRLSFSLLRSALLCLRGTRTSAPKEISVHDIDCEATAIESRIDMRLN